MGVAEAMRESPGEALDRLCRETGRKKQWVAKRLGLTSTTLSARISGRVRLTYLEAKELSRIFEVPLETFWPGEREASA